MFVNTTPDPAVTSFCPDTLTTEDDPTTSLFYPAPNHEAREPTDPPRVTGVKQGTSLEVPFIVALWVLVRSLVQTASQALNAFYNSEFRDRLMMLGT